MCHATLDVYTDDPYRGAFDVNMAATHGIISIGCGYTQMKELAVLLDVPPMHKHIYLKHQKKLGVAYNEACQESMKGAGEEETRLALEENNVDQNREPVITVISDGAWSKRSYKTNYNAASGVVSFFLILIFYCHIRVKIC